MAMELWDPFAEAISLRDAMDRLLQESFIRPSGASGQRGLQQQQAAMLPLDVKESEDGYTIQASLPGIKPEDVQIQIMGDTVTIRGETREDREEKRGEQVIMHERRVGRFARTLTLALPVDADKADANFENGVLTLRLPKAEQAKPRRIQVHSGNGQQADGHATVQGQATETAQGDQAMQDQAAVQGAAGSMQGMG